MLADALSLFRLIAAFPLAWAMWGPGREAAILAAFLITLAILSDLADGRIARWLGTESARGRLLDHGADFATVSGALFAASLRGALPLLLPILICVAFLQYVVDSGVVRRERQLRMSRLGKWNGILYFFPVCGDILARLGLGFLACFLRHPRLDDLLNQILEFVGRILHFAELFLNRLHLLIQVVLALALLHLGFNPPTNIFF